MYSIAMANTEGYVSSTHTSTKNHAKPATGR